MSKHEIDFSEIIGWIFGLAVVALIGWAIISGIINATSGTNGNSSSSHSQTYWYCWDSGDPKPHHLGHRVSGDHYCSDEELENK